MSKSWKKRDANFNLEQEKYANPIPSREFILDHLEKCATPLYQEQMVNDFGLKEADSISALRFRLLAMVRDGQLLQTRKKAFALIDKMDLIVGRVEAHRDGFGFLAPEDGRKSIFMPSKQMRRLFDGDKIVIRQQQGERRDRPEGVVIEVLERNTHEIVGRYYEEGGSAFVVADSTKINRDIMVKPSAIRPQSGQYVLLKIIEQPQIKYPAIGVVERIIGDHMAPGMEIDVAIHSHNLPHQWPQSVLDAAQTLPEAVQEKDKKNRQDLRHLPFVTIDGEQAKDFDDAVYCQPKASGGWRLFVAIADVSHYVLPGSELDQEAIERGNSVYFPGYVLPMLPEKLSNGLCSLNPHVDRLALVCEMTISQAGRLSGYQFYQAVICSHGRLTYDQANQALGKNNQEFVEKVWFKPLEHLHKLYLALHKARLERSAIDFETVETQIEFGEGRKIEKIVPVKRNRAHRLIEECMLCANVAAARFIKKAKLPCLYRVHNSPKPQKLLNLKNFLAHLGLSLPNPDKPKPEDYQQLLQQVRERPDSSIIQTMLLRSMNQAIYTPEKAGHFGLGFPSYTHFTSPIRRYPDLLVHRGICQILAQQAKQNTNHYPYQTANMVQFGEHCSMTERRADEASRDVTNWLKCEYMQQHLGEQFTGTVTSVTGFGLFIEVQDIYVEGLLHISGLPGDYYHFEQAKQCLRGERTGAVIGLGDKIQIVVAKVNLEDRKIDFDLADSPLSGKKSRKKKSLAGVKKTAKKKTTKTNQKADKKAPLADKKTEKKPKKKSAARKKASSKTKVKSSLKPKKNAQGQVKTPRKKTAKKVTSPVKRGSK